ncbi:MAG: two-component system CheB/CheR fusion protein [Myxococcota bacterium]|jgi:two-component system CheB/CheR fusion protein
MKPERLRRFFVREHGGFRVRKSIRDCVVFSTQNILQDPPFSRLDLVSCRNLLIYLDTTAQRRLLWLFHYTLKPDGFLFLGASETVGTQDKLFADVDPRAKIYRRRDSLARTPFSVRRHLGWMDVAPPEPSVIESISHQPTDMSRIAAGVVRSRFSPTVVLINGCRQIVHVHGPVGLLLQIPSGAWTSDVVDMAREDLRLELSHCIRDAQIDGGR